MDAERRAEIEKEMLRKKELVEHGITWLMKSWTDGGMSGQDIAAALLATSASVAAEVSLPLMLAAELLSRGYLAAQRAFAEGENKKPIIKH